MIEIHPIHRRLAELTERSNQVGFAQLTPTELADFATCLDANLRQVQKLSRLAGLITAAQAAKDEKWRTELEQRADKILKGESP